MLVFPRSIFLGQREDLSFGRQEGRIHPIDRQRQRELVVAVIVFQFRYLLDCPRAELLDFPGRVGQKIDGLPHRRLCGSQFEAVHFLRDLRPYLYYIVQLVRADDGNDRIDRSLRIAHLGTRRIAEYRIGRKHLARLGNEEARPLVQFRVVSLVCRYRDHRPFLFIHPLGRFLLRCIRRANDQAQQQ